MIRNNSNNHQIIAQHNNNNNNEKGRKQICDTKCTRNQIDTIDLSLNLYMRLYRVCLCAVYIVNSRHYSSSSSSNLVLTNKHDALTHTHTYTIHELCYSFVYFICLENQRKTICNLFFKQTFFLIVNRLLLLVCGTNLPAVPWACF